MNNKGTGTTIIILLVFLATAVAQNNPIGKGSIIIDTGFALNSDGGDVWENDDGERRTAYESQTMLGYFIMPGLAIGGQFLIEGISQGDWSSSLWGIGPQATYYLGGNSTDNSVKGQVYPFVSAGYARLNSKEDYSDYDFEFSANVFWTDLGAVYMLNNYVGAFGSIGYQLWGFEFEDDSDDGNRFAMNFGLAVFLH
jgi:hypothetical protein